MSFSRVLVGGMFLFILVIGGIAQAELRGYYKFDDVNILGKDSSGYNNHALWGSTSSYTTGKAGYGFMGTGQTYLKDSPLFGTATNTVTMTAWVKRTDVAVDTFEYIFFDRTSQIGLIYYKGGGGGYGYSWGSENPNVVILIKPQLNEWIFFATVIESTKMTTYWRRPGENLGKASMTTSYNARACTDPFIASKYEYGPTQQTGFFKGVIDEVRIYNHALTESEITALSEYPPSNQAPVVEAGSNQNTDVNYIQLNGSASDDGDPNPPGTITKSWSQVSGPGTVVFEPNASVLNPIARFSSLGTYVLKLDANDGELETSDTVTINYKLNDPPTVEAGADRNGISTATITLSGSVQDDGLPKTPGKVSVTWSQVSGPGTVTFEPNSHLLNATARFSVCSGSYVLRLTGSDGQYEANDIITITYKQNDPPIVDAGANRTGISTATVILSGSVQDDGLPNPPGKVSVTWSQVSGPGTVTFEPNANLLNSTARFSVCSGSYVLRLTGNDGQYEANDTVTITYKDNSAPTVQAPTDRYISSYNADLSCIVSDDGLPNPPGEVMVSWSQVNGPGTVTFTPSADVPNPTAHFSAEGVYVLRITGNDSEYESEDTMTVNCHLQFINPALIKTSSSADYGDFANPDVNKLTDDSGFDANGLHNNSFYDMCYIWDTTDSNTKYDNEISAAGKVWFAFEFNRAYTLDKIWLWNYNNVPAYGMKDITIAYSADKDNWSQYSCQLAQADGNSESVQIADIPNVSAKYVVIIANTNYQTGTQNKFGLSEVKFNYVASGSTKATLPEPANSSTNPALDTVLSWMGASGLDVASHKVYISTSRSGSAVTARTCGYVNTTVESYTPSNLVAGATYYWAVDEVDVNGNVIAGGSGDLWYFTVGSMGIRNTTVNGTLLGTIPMERNLVYANGTSRGEAQVIRSNNGELYSVIYKTNLLFKSCDGGRTWSSKSLSPLTPDPNDGHPAFTIQKDDSFFTINVPYVAQDPNYDAYYRVDHKLWAHVNRSIDYGNNWQTLTRIYSSPYDTMVEGSMTLSSTYDGRLLYALRRWTWDWDYASHGLPNYWYDRYSAQAIAEGRHDFTLYYSDDNGSTWQKTPTFDFVGESHIIQLQSGKLLSAFRYQRYWIPSGVEGFTPDTDASVAAWGGDYTQKTVTSTDPWGSCVFKNVFVGESFDNGVTWQNLHPLQDASGNTLVKFGQAHGDLVQVPDGRVVMVHDHRIPDSERQLIARVSNDEGNTWEPEVYKITMGDGYPSSVALEDGTIITVTGDDTTAPYTSSAIRWRLPAKKAGTPKASLKVVRKYAIAGREVLFDASDSNDTENNIVKYEWDFHGDNHFDYNETTNNHSDGKFNGKTKYAYTTAGEYTARVRVTDSNGLNDTYNIYHIIVSDDLDNDDMPDGWETRNGLNPNDANDALIDSDGDGYSNLSEYLHQSNPHNDHSLPTPTKILVPADIESLEQTQSLAIEGDVIIEDLVCDLNNDEVVDWVDFAIFNQNWMGTSSGLADFNNDGNVDWEDLGWFSDYWLAGAAN